MAQFNDANASTRYNRRQFLKHSSALIVAASCPSQLFAKTNESANRNLAFKNLHTNETLQCCYWKNGQQNLDALAKINHILRDHRTQEVAQIDTHLLDLLYKLHLDTGSKSPFEIISGYRSPQTNAKLRKSTSGVAKKSLHMQGKAIDIRLPDVALKTLRDQAIELQAGGVGYYSKSGFIHVDTGKPRQW